MRKLILVGMVGWIMGCCCGLPALYEDFLERVTGADDPRIVYGEGAFVSEERALGDFSAIDLMGEGQLYIEVGEPAGMWVTAQENLLLYLVTRVENDTLYIRTRKNTGLYTGLPIRYDVTVESLDALSLGGYGYTFVKPLTAQQFDLNVSGSVKLWMDGLAVDRMNVRHDGSGEIVLVDLEARELKVNVSGDGIFGVQKGRVDTQEIQIADNASYVAGNLDSAIADVKIPGRGSATLRVSDELSVFIYGSGDVLYTGSPVVEQTVLGSGSVRQIGK